MGMGMGMGMGKTSNAMIFFSFLSLFCQPAASISKDVGWNLLSSDRLYQPRANKDVAWEASGVFFPMFESRKAESASARPKCARELRSPSPTSNECSPSPASKEHAPCEVERWYPAFVQCGMLAPVRALAARSTCRRQLKIAAGGVSGRARRPLVSGPTYALRMSSNSASAVPSWEDLHAKLPLNKRRFLEKGLDEDKDEPPLTAAAAAAAAYVGAGTSVNMDIILRSDEKGLSPGCRRVKLALLEKGVDFKELAGSDEEVPVPELVLGDELVTGWEACLLRLEEAVLRVPLLPSDPSERSRAVEVMRQVAAVVPDSDVRRPWGSKQRQTTVERLQELESLLAASCGDFVLGNTFSLVDIALFPALEACDAQAAILVPALRPSENPSFPALQKWYSAMDSRVASYRSRVKGDVFSTARALASEEPAMSAVALEGANKALGAESWKEVLCDEVPAVWNMYAERFPQVATTPKMEAAAYLYTARQALGDDARAAVPECVNGARRPRAGGSGAEGVEGLGAEGQRVDVVDATLRLLMSALVEAPEYARSPTFANMFVKGMLEEWGHDELTEVKDVLLFLREAVRVPRDMGELPARQWRAHASWLGSEVRKLLKKMVVQAEASAPKPLRSRY